MSGGSAADSDDALSSSEDTLIASEGNVKTTHIVISGCLAVFIGVSTIIVSIVVYKCTGGTIPFDHGIVIDAGSTHTEAYLYKWLGSKDHGTGDVVQEKECTYKAGIATLSDPAVVVDCVRNVTESIPDSEKSHSPLYFAATGGMRLLNLTEPEVVHLILLELKCKLKELGVDVKDVNVIPGFQEGAYAWITVNFLKKLLTSSFASWNKTYGALDMGGASTQISFATGVNSTLSMKLYGHQYNVYSTEFQCFGAVQAFNRHQALLIKNLTSDEIIEDPCLPTGNITIVNAERLLGGPCIITPKYEDWLQVKENRLKNFTFQGSSKYNECQDLVQELINNTACKIKGFNMCAKRINIPNKSMKFMAFSSFFYVTNFLNATNVSLADFSNITQNWCKLSWEDIENKKFSPKIFSHLTQYCFGALYITKWLTDIYGFQEDSWSSIVFQQMVDNTELGWAVGLMIYATNAIPPESPTEPFISLEVFVILLLCSLFIVILGILLTQQYCRDRCKYSKTRYRRFTET